ncbi:L,D-transpeptidase family protein [Alteriqipengyuania lutimaris]|uniref:L,D-transpeptidase n=1 Tax=Alteriqipengyuania lutimaris TaxID=1538146 RepID=A0A395LPF5_9SPHN|nr:L,D-transpeptidase family protein [Alteriqipengyuania lutimaris]MBB3033561.1 lipoprotein-anchoring transpeptidase ErfK/SrfK [Alteriqipengyuania lutimaris]RDS77434.1 L,D-transpeptidase [Alteriqipengyuania lutimaris]
MTKALIWIGGATLALVLLLGGASIAARYLDDAATSETTAAAPDIEDAIPVDPSKFGDSVADGDDASPLESEPSADPQDSLDLTDETVDIEGTPGTTARPAGEDRAADGDVIYDARERAVASRSTPARAEKMVVKRVLPIDGPIRYGEWHWDTEGVPPGKIVMTVDLDARVISVFRGGYEIGAAAVLLGTQEHPTPLGTFPIRYKMRHNVSEKYNNAPMPYSMFLTSDGVALHGSQVENGYASHGCIGLPNEFAAKVFAVASKGDKVIITRGKTMQMGSPIG